MGTPTLIIGDSSLAEESGCDPLFFDNRIVLSQHLRNYSTMYYATHVVATQQQSKDINVFKPKAVIWVWSRPGWMKEAEESLSLRLKRFDYVFCYETDNWVTVFECLGARGYMSKRVSTPIFSSGMAAIIIAAHRLGEDIVTLGFNDFWNSDLGLLHDWPVERELLRKVESHYNIKVKEWTN